MPQSITMSQLGAHLKKDAIAPLYALIGEEDLLRDAGLSLIKQAVLAGEGDDFNCDLFYGDEAEGTAIVACASASTSSATLRSGLARCAFFSCTGSRSFMFESFFSYRRM